MPRYESVQSALKRVREDVALAEAWLDHIRNTPVIRAAGECWDAAWLRTYQEERVAQAILDEAQAFVIRVEEVSDRMQRIIEQSTTAERLEYRLFDKQHQRVQALAVRQQVYAEKGMDIEETQEEGAYV